MVKWEVSGITPSTIRPIVVSTIGHQGLLGPLPFKLERARRKGRVELDHDDARGTVGAVARDPRGHLAAATSTGGLVNKLPGRVGDSPLIGSGTWASDATCAVSFTGSGESAIRAAAAHEVDALLRLAGLSLEQASARALAGAAAMDGSGGLIAIDSEGHFATPFDTRALYRGWIGMRGDAVVKIFDDE